MAAHVRRLRQEGFPDYDLLPSGPLEPDPEGYGPVLYLEPADGRNQRAFARDLLREQVRRQALLRARDTGLLTLTGPITLFQETDTDIQSGALLLAPVYRPELPRNTVAERRQALRGWVYFPFRMGDLVRASLAREMQYVELRLSDATESSGGRLFFNAGANRPEASAQGELTRQVEVAGRAWMAKVHSNIAFFAEAGQRNHWELLASGVTISLMLFVLLATMHGAEARAGRLAQRRGEALEITEARFRSLFDRAPFGMAIVDSGSGRFLSVNARMGDILGYTPGELEARNFQSVTHPKHLEADLASVRGLVSGAQETREVRKVKRYLHRDGHEVWGRLSMVRLPSAPGEFARHLSIVEDITEARARGEELKASEARFHGIFDLSPDPITLSNLSDSRLLMASQSWCDLTGIPLEEALGHTPGELGTWSQPEEREALLAELRRTGRVVARPSVLRHRDGRERQVLISAQVLCIGPEELVLVMGKDVTELDKAQAALQESESRWKLALEAAGDGVWEWTEGASSIYLSPSYKAMLGYGVAEPFGTSFVQWIDRIHPEDRPGILFAVNAYLDGMQPVYEQEYRMQRRDGSYLWVLARGATLERDAAGRPTRIIGTHTDITTRKETELALAQSETRLRILGDQLPDSFLYQLVTEMDGRSRFVYLSAGVERLCGLKPEALLADPDLLFAQLDAPTLQLYRAEELACAKAMQPLAMDLRLRRVDGHWRWLRVRSRPHGQSDGSLLWEGITTDVTDEVMGRAALAESEARFRHQADAAPALIWMADTAGRCTYFSGGWSAWTGRPVEEALGEAWVDFLHPEDRPCCLAISNRALQAREPFTLEFRLRHSSGTYRWISDHARPRQAEDGTFLGYIGVGIDIQEMKEAEATSRASELRARKAESLVLMAGGIAHDFKTSSKASWASWTSRQRRRARTQASA